MSFNEEKIRDIMHQECEKIKERCEGYREELVKVINDIIVAERQHRVQATTIQKKINDRLNLAGQFLMDKRSRS